MTALTGTSADTDTTITSAWRRPDVRTLLVHCGWLAPPLGSLALTALATGGRIPASALITLAALAVSFAAVTAFGLIRWSRTQYRLTADSFALRSGVLNRRLRTVPLHRVRSVDLTATPLHRLLGLTIVRAGTTTSGDGRGEIALNALTVRDAHRLRTALLARADTLAPADEPVIARIDWRWLRYAPLTFWVFGGVGIAAGSVYRVFDAMGIELWRVGFVQDAFREFGSSMLWLTVPAALLAVIILGSIGALALYVENWWGFSAAWTDARTLTVRRGLLTTRSVTIERARLRGVLLREPLLLRAAGGASAAAVAGGLGNSEETRSRSALLPPAPREEALRVTAGALRMAQHPFANVELTPHPRAALRRRLMRGLLFLVLPTTVALLVLGMLLTPVLLHCAWIFASAATPVVWLSARDAYRSLGHALHGCHLLVRAGTFSRDTLALERDAIAAWTFSSSPFARRAGLVTVTAAVAAGEHGYHIRDMADDGAVGFAAASAPGILEEFLDDPQPHTPHLAHS
ncbi:PH domain-containing protein [Streptomyces sp. NBC_01142]|uniref:PH domain-containing protein n=1 Tax=Streptomyces sp. NBC_01142 TaxID=2975865 RepID=UPI002257B6B0|nr:PH domain-containing protein [Streptomyces sp. NBC_01142]MCX4820396.1 PH domain-containing protein [Streptomyces sp. NBC_01142]